MAFGSDGLSLLFRILSDSTQARGDITGLRSHIAKEANAIKVAGARDFNAFRKEYEDNIKRADAARAKTVFAAAYPHSKDAASFRVAWDNEFKKLNFADFGKKYDAEMLRIRSSTQDTFLKLAQHFNLSAEGAAKLATGLRLAATAAVALSVAAIGAGVGIFQMVNRVSEAIDDLADLSAQINVDIETLSTFKNLTEEAGGEINTIGQALVFFQRQMFAAHDPTSKQGQLFRRLNIDTNDTAKAVRDAFHALHQMGEGMKQTEATAQLFGARGGKQVLGLVKLTNGELDLAAEKYKKLGTLIGTDAAEAANKFQHELKGLQQQLRGVMTEAAIELMPVITKRLNEISEWVTDNREEIINTIVAVGGFLDAAIIKPLTFIVGLLHKAVELSEWLKSLAPAGDSGGQAYYIPTGIGMFGLPFDFVAVKPDFGAAKAAKWGQKPSTDIKQPKSPGIDLPGGGGGKADPRIKALEDEEKEAERIYRAETEALKNQYEQRKLNLEAYTEAIITKTKELFEAQREIINQQRALAKPSERGKYDDELSAAEGERDKNIRKALTEQAKTMLALKRDLQEKLLDVQDEFDRRDINAVRARIQINENALFRSAASKEKVMISGEARIAEIEEAAYQRRKTALIEQQNELIILAAGKDGERIKEHIRRLEEDAALGAKSLEQELSLEEKKRLLTVEQRQQLTQEVAAVQAKANQEELTRLDAHLKVLEEKEVTAADERERRIAEAEARRLARSQHANNVIENLRLAVESGDREARRRALDEAEASGRRHQILTTQQRAWIIYQRATLDLEEIDANHQRIKRELETQKQITLATVKGEDERKLVRDRYRDLDKQEDERWQSERRARAKQADDETNKTAGGAGKGIFDDVREMINELPDLSPVEFGANAVAIAFRNMKQAVLDSIDAFIFYGESIGQVMKKAVAQTLAEIAKEAAIQGIRQAALALGSLAVLDFRGAALHAAASAAWFSISYGAARLGRSVVGDMYKQTGSQAGESAQRGATGGDNPPPQVTPVKEEWRQKQAAEMAQAAADMRIAATQFRAAANRLHSVSAGDVVRAGAPDAEDVIISVLEDNVSRYGRMGRLIKDEAWS